MFTKEQILEKFVKDLGTDQLNAEQVAKLMGDAMSEFEQQIKDQKASKVKALVSGELDEADDADSKIKDLENKKVSAKFFQLLAQGNHSNAQELARKSWGKSAAKVEKALNEGTGSAGGFLVPVQFDNQVRMYLDTYSQLMSRALVLPMSSKTLNLNTLTATVTISKPGEATAGTASQPTFVEPILTARKRIGYTIWSSELYEDAEVDVLDILAKKFAEAIAKDIQTDCISSATSGSEGLLTVSGVTSVTLPSTKTAFSDITWDAISELISKLQAISMSDAEGLSILMNPTVYHYLRVLKTSGSGEYVLPAAPSATNVPSAWGFPIVLVNEMPAMSASAANTKFVCVTNLKNHLVIGLRKGIAVKILSEGTIGSVNLGETDQEAIRVTQRSANTTILQNGIGVIVTAAS